MAREDVIIPQLEPAATDYNKDNLDRNFNDVSDTLGRLRDALTVVANEPSGDLTDLENTVASLVEDVYDPVTGLGQTRARLLTEEGVRADADLALAARATTLEATVNDGTTGLVATRARLITEESTRATADSALASRATTLEATVNDSTTGLVATRARLITEESTRATADAALATRATTLEARSFVKGNLVKGARPYYDSTSPNSLFSRFGYVSQGLWSVAYSVYVDGPYFSQGLTSVSGYTWNAMLSNAISIAAGQPISAQAMLGKFGTWTAGTLRLVVYWYTDAAGTTGASQAGDKAWEAGVVIAGQNGNGRWVDLPNLVAPSGTQSFRIGIWTDNVTGNGVYTEGAAWMLKAEYGSTCTAWSDEALPVEIDARVRTEESTRATADTALASRATTLEATVNDGTTGLVATRARLITEESTRATADTALAIRSDSLEATVKVNPNLLRDSTFKREGATTSSFSLEWSNASGVNWYRQDVFGLGSFAQIVTNGTQVLTSTNFEAVNAGQVFSLQAEFRCGGLASTAVCLVDIIWTNNSGLAGIIGYSSPVGVSGADYSAALATAKPGGWVRRTSSTSGLVAPTGATRAYVRAYVVGTNTDSGVRNIKLEAGQVCTLWTDENTSTSINASVNINAAAIATLQGAVAIYEILVAASGGDPAIVRLKSGLGGSEVTLAAKVLSLINTSSGVAMPVMRATGGEAFFQRPISSDSAGRRVTIGPGYGVSGSEVVLWFGPSSIAPDDQSRTNGTFALGTDGQVYYGGTGLQTGSMQMELNTYVVNLTRLGTGTTSTSMTATGYAPGTLSYSWTLHSGDAVNIGSPSSATTNIGHTLTALGQTKTSVVKCTITSTAGPTTFRLLDISSSEIS